MSNGKDTILVCDNTRPDVALGTRRNLGLGILALPPYSWDVESSDQHFFLSLQNCLGDRNFKNEEDVRQQVLVQFLAPEVRYFLKIGYTNCYHAGKKSNNDGNYVIQ